MATVMQRIVREVGRRAGIERVVTPGILRRTAGENLLELKGVRTRKRLLEEAADGLLDIILVSDDERRFVDLNRAGLEALGVPPEAVLGRKIEEFFRMLPGTTVASAWDDFVRTGEQSGVCELLRTRASFAYRARAHFLPGLHVSVLRPIR